MKAKLKFEKLRRDGNVAVLHFGNFGSGWLHEKIDDGLLFDRDIVECVLAKDFASAADIVANKYPEVDTRNVNGLAVAWVPEGSRFFVSEYDGLETVQIIGPDFGHVA